MVSVNTDYIAVGGNRHPAGADWDPVSGQLVFGAANNIALWNPLDDRCLGVRSLLCGHSDNVNVVKFFPSTSSNDRIILSGSADKTVRIWKSDTASPSGFSHAFTIEDHQSSINSIAVSPDLNVFATGAADATIRIYQLRQSEIGTIYACLIQTIQPSPRYFPLTLALSPLNGSGSMALAVAGTKPFIQVYVSAGGQSVAQFELKATLSGHEGWIRSLAFTWEKGSKESDLLLASASQDKYIRLWRIHEGEQLPPASAAGNDPALGTFGKSLSNKPHRFEAAGLKYSITFEALLVGHEDWIYTCSWRPTDGPLQLLTASADNSLSIWTPDPASGIWICIARLGEISAQKGSTTATGSAGGFWQGLWSPNGESVVSLGRTGSWRLWNYNKSQDRWLQAVAVTGHVKSVMGVCWAADGKYLLSTGSDQTTRLFAEWKRGQKRSWHEFARPQIHGYDLNCIDVIRESQFISGADEKLLRVFDEPKAVANLLKDLCGIEEAQQDQMPDAANIPVLGLSNKAIEAVEDGASGGTADDDEQAAIDPSSVIQKSTLELDHPPFEDHLARHTLWPESEKLYGHGYEISAVATSHDNCFVATACRASSVDHAVIRLFDTKEWREVKPSLAAHSLTVTSLQFSGDDRYLLSVGRDRQWTIFERDESAQSVYKLACSNPKGHSRMILDASWAPLAAGAIFATAGRDKSVKIWQADNGVFTCKATIGAQNPVTAVQFLPLFHNNALFVAFGTEAGDISIAHVHGDFTASISLSFDQRIVPSKAITDLAWRQPPQDLPSNGIESKSQQFQLAVASEDSSLRIYSISNML
ncbi:putative RNA polymerase II Elongator subunit [Xylona heveae TC161]|uniref:Elongator complex protein 2 n=1 Tax=Xylona heveae (strain CBS 132557 / TC161) TaxID=1328760 RepID=A0A165FRA3_XYLHT|nr:putative RNA polymerase II Elongator subunit [Xylona heveae TC161]KZF21285.1 putative RNA polymerase II Elongator subunit [Xylona heveae TC161]